MSKFVMKMVDGHKVRVPVEAQKPVEQELAELRAQLQTQTELLDRMEQRYRAELSENRQKNEEIGGLKHCVRLAENLAEKARSETQAAIANDQRSMACLRYAEGYIAALQGKPYPHIYHVKEPARRPDHDIEAMMERIR